MDVIELAHPTDLAGWRHAARALMHRRVPAENVEWRVVGHPDRGLFAPRPLGAAETPSHAALALTVPRRFVDLCEQVITHRDEGRFALLYRLLVRLRDEPRLLELAVDPDVTQARRMAQAVARDIHKMHAYVRFRAIATADATARPAYAAWFEPRHYIVERAAPFFAKRFANMQWSIFTPDRCAHWDGHALTFSAGTSRDAAPDHDALEDLWRTYFASIFNPARLNPTLMKQQMPTYYWRNLPEATVIAPLMASASHRVQRMVDAAPTQPALRSERLARRHAGTTSAPGPGMDLPPEIATPRDIEALPQSLSLADVRAAVGRCRACPLWGPATQAVFGHGPVDAALMVVGEQPGDQEDIAGRPFVGPAGRLLDRALAQAGIDRSRAYVTNAVKHFKYVVRGERRLHQRPKVTEIRACQPWLDRELALVRPRIIVALGATAATALLGTATTIERARGAWLSHGTAQLRVTVHPSALLRVPDAASKAREFERFVADLRAVAEALRALAPP